MQVDLEVEQIDMLMTSRRPTKALTHLTDLASLLVSYCDVERAYATDQFLTVLCTT